MSFQIQLKKWIQENNSALALRIEYKDQYTAVCAICDEYGIEKPKPFDNVESSSGWILEQIQSRSWESQNMTWDDLKKAKK